MAKSLKNSKFKVFIALLLACVMAMTVVITACGGGGKISLDVTEYEMYIADTLKLTATAPEDAEITWSSSDDKVATVRRGTVTAVAVGTATITASLDSGASATCEITVKDRSVSISSTEETIDLDSENWTVTLTATASDGGAIIWSSSDASLAKVENGVVTATGANIGDVTITAQRGAATATCLIHIIQPSRPEDWRLLTSGQQADVFANPGVWYYLADDASGVSYVQAPWYGGNAVGVSFAKAPDLGNKKRFYFRYQPAIFEEGENGETVNVLPAGENYHMTFTITVNANVTVTYGGKQVNISANEPEYIEYNGTVSDNKEGIFQISISAAGTGVSQYLEGVSFVISEITLGAGHIVIEDKQPAPQEPGSEYELEYADKAKTLGNPNKWFYMVDSDGNGANEIVEARHANGVTTLALNSTTAGKTYQLRFQPWLEEGYNTPYTAKLTVNVSAQTDILVGRDGDTKTYSDIVVGEDYDIVYNGTLSASAPFYIQLKNFTAGEAITLVVKEVSFSVRELVNEPDSDLEKKSNADCVAAPGMWYYHVDGSAATFSAAPHYNADKSLSVTFETAPVIADSQYFYFRYQPAFGVGKYYSVTMTVEISADVTIRYGQPGTTATGGKNNDVFKTEEITANVPAEITFEGSINAEEPFSVRIHALGEGVGSLDGVSFKLSDINIVEINAPVEDGSSYDLKYGGKAAVSEDPGVWYYMIDALGLGENEKNEASYKDGVVTLDLKTTNALTSEEKVAVFQLRYQPDYTVGTEYTISFNVTLTAEAYLVIGNDASRMNYPDGASAETPSYLEANVAHPVTYNGTVATNDPFYIQIMAKDTDAPIKITVSSISVEEYTEGNDNPGDDTDEDVTYELTYGDKGTTIGNAGTWFYMIDEQDRESIINTKTYVNGVVTLGLDHTNGLTSSGSNASYQLRYQPKLAVGASYTITFKVEVSAQAWFIVGRDGATKNHPSGASSTAGLYFQPDVENTVTYSGTVDGSNPFYIQIKAADTSAPITVTVSEVTLSESYDLTWGGKGDTVGNPGHWFYMINTSGNGKNEVEEAKYDDGVVTLALNTTAATQSDGSTAAYQLRYQPKLDVDTAYTMTFKVTLTAEAYLIVGRDGATINYPEGANATAGVYCNANQEYTVTYTGAVHASEPVFIQIKAADTSAPITITVYDVQITAN